MAAIDCSSSWLACASAAWAPVTDAWALPFNIAPSACCAASRRSMAAVMAAWPSLTCCMAAVIAALSSSTLILDTIFILAQPGTVFRPARDTNSA